MEPQPVSGLGILFYVIGGLAALIGIIGLAGSAADHQMSNSDMIGIFSMIGSGLLFLAVGNALFHLRRIEHHLFKMREKRQAEATSA